MKKIAEKKLRAHRGDIMSPEKRSVLMSRIRGRDTGPERMIAERVSGLGFRWESHSADLPGRPDFVFRDQRVAVFVDGDFWHGSRFPTWRHKLSEAWEEKLAANIKRDQRNRRILRRNGWRVVGIWEHQIERDLPLCIDRITRALFAIPSRRIES
ncbi:very short patch repair endonuclease [Bradyrhizobium sp. 27S5]|uniref:very short patch repair endonuclease n=1 Tax=Bradyrhizobium sp. 27S5 TaxID=3139728 RepID=UPI0030D0DFB3